MTACQLLLFNKVKPAPKTRDPAAILGAALEFWQESRPEEGDLFQLADGTSPVTAAGQDVKYRADRGGHGYHMTAPDIPPKYAAPPPAVDYGGGTAHLEFVTPLVLPGAHVMWAWGTKAAGESWPPVFGDGNQGVFPHAGGSVFITTSAGSISAAYAAAGLRTLLRGKRLPDDSWRVASTGVAEFLVGTLAGTLTLKHQGPLNAGTVEGVIVASGAVAPEAAAEVEAYILSRGGPAL